MERPETGDTLRRLVELERLNGKMLEPLKALCQEVYKKWLYEQNSHD